MLNSVLNQETGPWATNGLRRKREAGSRPLVQSVLEEEEEGEDGRVDDDLPLVESFVGGAPFVKLSETYCLPPAPIFHRPRSPPPFFTSPTTTLSALPSPSGYASSVDESEDSFSSYPASYSSYASPNSARDYLPPVEDLFPLYSSTSANPSNLPSDDRTSLSAFFFAALDDPFGLSKGEFGQIEAEFEAGGFQQWKSESTGRHEDVEMEEEKEEQRGRELRREEKQHDHATTSRLAPPAIPSFFSPSFFSAEASEHSNPYHELGQYHFPADPPPSSSSSAYFSSNPPHGRHHVPSHTLAPPPPPPPPPPLPCLFRQSSLPSSSTELHTHASSLSFQEGELVVRGRESSRSGNLYWSRGGGELWDGFGEAEEGEGTVQDCVFETCLGGSG